MEKREDILKMAFKHLQSIGKVVKMKDVKEAMAQHGTRPETVSRAFNGHLEYASDQFMLNFAKSFPGIFNISWLLFGEGEMLMQNHPTGQDAVIQFLMDQIAKKDCLYDDLVDRLERIEDILFKQQHAQRDYGSWIVAEDVPSYGTEKGLREKTK